VLSLVLMMAFALGTVPRVAEAQATIKPPSSYNQQEREAVEVVKDGSTRDHLRHGQVDVHMSVSRLSRRSPRRSKPPHPFRRMALGVMNGWCGGRRGSLVIGGPRDTMVMIGRIDNLATVAGLRVYDPARGHVSCQEREDRRWPTRR
jgi:hypothetical protein